MPHTLSAVCLPNLTSCRLPSQPRVLPLAFKLLAERCPGLTHLELTCCKVNDYTVQYVRINRVSQRIYTLVEEKAPPPPPSLIEKTF